jgi:hypothetical protein
LRAEFGMADKAIVEWWVKLQTASPEQRAAMSEAIGRSAGGAEGRGAPRGRNSRRRRGGRHRGRGGGPGA